MKIKGVYEFTETCNHIPINTTIIPKQTGDIIFYALLATSIILLAAFITSVSLGLYQYSNDKATELKLIPTPNISTPNISTQNI